MKCSRVSKIKQSETFHQKLHVNEKLSSFSKAASHLPLYYTNCGQIVGTNWTLLQLESGYFNGKTVIHQDIPDQWISEINTHDVIKIFTQSRWVWGSLGMIGHKACIVARSLHKYRSRTKHHDFAPTFILTSTTLFSVLVFTSN